MSQYLQQTVTIPCRDNIYTHRKPKKLYEDDIMVCQCKPASQKGISCHHEDCLNGMLNIECVNGFCDCGKECKNQRFQRRQYSKFEVRRAGLKGFGLFALEDIKKGAFIVEYVGEVLDEEEYLRRKEYYHSVGQRHYYFMNIGNGEVCPLPSFRASLLSLCHGSCCSGMCAVYSVLE
jgi:AWS domain/SET domain